MIVKKERITKIGGGFVDRYTYEVNNRSYFFSLINGNFLKFECLHKLPSHAFRSDISICIDFDIDSLLFLHQRCEDLAVEYNIREALSSDQQQQHEQKNRRI